MRWLARRHRPAPPRMEPIERIDPASLEVVEVDASGRVHGPSTQPRAAPRPIEIGYAPRERDPTGLAGVWEAVAGS